MSNFKFTPKKGVLVNVQQFIRTSTATAAITAANGLALAQTVNKTITDGLAVANAVEVMAMANASNFFSEKLGEEVTIQNIRNGDVTDLVEEANASYRILAAKKGQYRKAKEEMKLQKKLNKLEKKLALLKEQK